MDGLGISPHVIDALQYCEDVISGEQVAGLYMRRACQRQLDDLERAAADPADWPWRYDAEKAARACRFIELLPHIKGEWARRRERITLGAWQKFIITTVFGWVHKDTGLRRFRTVYEEVARKNAKSTKMSGIGLYMLAADGEAGPEVYSAASKRDQAKIVFGDAHAMASRTPDFRSRFNVETFARAIVCNENGGRFSALDGEGKTQDGLNVHLAICDELHAHKNRTVYDVLETATGARSQPLIWNITTAGHNQSGICFEVRGYAVKVLEGTVTDDSFFAAIFTIDADDDWTDPAVWVKANPNLGVSVNPGELERLCLRAQKTPSFQNTFLTKHLNVWVNAATAWMNMEALKTAVDPDLRVEDFEGEPCTMGVDLSSKVDVASSVKVFTREIAGDRHYYAFARHYLPRETIVSSSNDSYTGWAHEGRMSVTEGNIIDLDVIEMDIMEDADRFQLAEVGYDPWQATQMAIHLQEAGIPVVEVRPSVGNFSEPMKELEALILDGRFHYDGDPVLTWMFSNVVAHRDHKDNIYPRKDNETNKIDGVVALITALARLISRETAQPSVYETRGVRAV